MKKVVLITGCAGQDGSHLADLLLEKEYWVIGMIRRNATRSLGNIAHLENSIDIEEGDITDAAFVSRTIQRSRPHEIYNLAAMSHVGTSFEQPLATLNIDALGVVNILEAVKTLAHSIRIYHASTSELWGDSPPPQNEETMMRPRSPYAISKLAAHWFIRMYREAYGIYCCSGITHNHEGPRRGPQFVTRKISMGVAKVLADPSHRIKLGNIDAARDWGYAPDFVEGFWRCLQQPKPDDYVFATGEMHTVGEFAEKAFARAGIEDWGTYIEIDRFMMRPLEVESLCGDPSKAKAVLGWEPKVKFGRLVDIMVEHDCRLLGVSDKLPAAVEGQ
jgi:GDPmannose 4,6-dehydratase